MMKYPSPLAHALAAWMESNYPYSYSGLPCVKSSKQFQPFQRVMVPSWHHDQSHKQDDLSISIANSLCERIPTLSKKTNIWKLRILALLQLIEPGTVSEDIDALPLSP